MVSDLLQVLRLEQESRGIDARGEVEERLGEVEERLYERLLF